MDSVASNQLWLQLLEDVVDSPNELHNNSLRRIVTDVLSMLNAPEASDFFQKDD